MIRHWVVLDLDVFRRHEGDARIRRDIQHNADGTHFVAYDILSFPPELVLGTSDTMTVALEYGVDAVEPLRPKYLDEAEERLRARLDADPPPDLQDLIRKHGSYSNVPPEVWTEWDRLNAAWQMRRRDNP